MVGAAGMPRLLVCTAGEGQLEYDGAIYPVGKGDVLLLPAVVGACLLPAVRHGELVGNCIAVQIVLASAGVCLPPLKHRNS